MSDFEIKSQIFWGLAETRRRKIIIFFLDNTLHKCSMSGINILAVDRLTWTHMTIPLNYIEKMTIENCLK